MGRMSVNRRSRNASNVAQQARHQIGGFSSSRHRSIELFKLCQCYSTRQLIHAVIQSQKIMVRLFISIAPCFVDEQETTTSQRFVIGDNDATFPSRDVLTLLQTKASQVAEGTNGLALIRRTKRLSTVFNNAQTCLLYTSPSPRDKRQSRMPSSA